MILNASKGLLLTDADVVANAEQITVRVMDGTETNAEVDVDLDGQLGRLLRTVAEP